MSLPSPFELGSIIGGKYCVLREIGQGGLGVVYEAEHIRLRQRVAIKVLAVERSRREMLARFEREARVMARLTSPHVARVHDVDVLDDGVPFIVMELLEGWDLHFELERSGGALAVADAVRIVVEAAEGVAQAHEAGVIHRDLKPSNLFLAREGDRRIVKLLDFGVSKVVEEETEMTGTGVTLGTAAYMSPEHVRSSRSVDARSDLWSLGVILFRCLAGTLPFRGEGPLGTALAIVTEPPIDIREFRDDVPPGLLAVLDRLLDKDPERRYGSARELIFALSNFAHDADAMMVSDRDATIVRPPPRGSVRQKAHPPLDPALEDEARESRDSDSASSTQQVVLTSVAAPKERSPSRTRRVFGGLVLLVALVTLGGALFVLLEPGAASRVPTLDRSVEVVRARASELLRYLEHEAPPASVTTPQAIDAGRD